MKNKSLLFVLLILGLAVLEDPPILNNNETNGNQQPAIQKVAENQPENPAKVVGEIKNQGEVVGVQPKEGAVVTEDKGVDVPQEPGNEASKENDRDWNEDEAGMMSEDEEDADEKRVSRNVEAGVITKNHVIFNRRFSKKDDDFEEEEDNLNENFEEEEKEVSKFKDATCNIPLMQMFNLYGLKNLKPQTTTPSLKSYCNIPQTCCSKNHYKNIIPFLSENLERLEKRLFPIIEMTDLFRGNMMNSYLKSFEESHDCIDIVREKFNTKRGPAYKNILDDSFYSYNIQKIKRLYMSIGMIKKKFREYFGSIVCSVCDPAYQRFFNLDKENNKITITFSNDFCLSVDPIVEFFLAVHDVLHNFVSKIISYISCIEKNSFNFNLPQRRYFFIHKLKQKYKKCKSNYTTDECKKFCLEMQDLLLVHTDILDMGQIRAVVKFLAAKMSGLDIEKFYTQYFDSTYFKGTELNPVQIFTPFSIIGRTYNFETYNAIFKEGEGVNPIKTPMGPSMQSKIELFLDSSD